MVKEYAQKFGSPSKGAEPSVSRPEQPGSIFAMAIALKGTPSSTAVVVDGKDEVDLYFGNISPVALDFDDPLGWWKVTFTYFPSLVMLNIGSRVCRELYRLWRVLREIFSQSLV